MFPAARIGDPITHDLVTPCGVIGPALAPPAGLVTIEFLPAAYVTCAAICTGVITGGIVHPPPPPTPSRADRERLAHGPGQLHARGTLDARTGHGRMRRLPGHAAAGRDPYRPDRRLSRPRRYGVFFVVLVVGSALKSVTEFAQAFMPRCLRSMEGGDSV